MKLIHAPIFMLLRPLMLALLLMLLSACGSVAFSPEAAALQAFSQNKSTGLTVDPDTVQAVLSLEISDNQTIVLITFEGTRQATGPETCINTYQVVKHAYGWAPANGGGVCRQNQPDQVVPDLEVSAGRYVSQSPQDPGYSQIYGLVNNPLIETVRVTWDDNTVTESEAGTGAFLAYRSGQFLLRTVEGLDDQDQVIYSHFSKPQPDS